MTAILVQLGGITILVNGKALSPTDSNGSVVQPIIYNETTYLPVRVVAESLEMNVGWNAGRATVTLGEGDNVTYLDALPAANFKSSTAGSSKFESLCTNEIDGKSCSRSLIILTQPAEEYAHEVATLSYMLNGEYKCLVSALDVRWEDYTGTALSTVKIYGDGKLLYTSPSITRGSNAYYIDVDVAGIKVLEIEVDMSSSWSYNYREHVFGEARLIK